MEMLRYLPMAAIFQLLSSMQQAAVQAVLLRLLLMPMLPLKARLVQKVVMAATATRKEMVLAAVAPAVV